MSFNVFIHLNPPFYSPSLNKANFNGQNLLKMLEFNGLWRFWSQNVCNSSQDISSTYIVVYDLWIEVLVNPFVNFLKFYITKIVTHIAVRLFYFQVFFFLGGGVGGWQGYAPLPSIFHQLKKKQLAMSSFSSLFFLGESEDILFLLIHLFLSVHLVVLPPPPNQKAW